MVKTKTFKIQHFNEETNNFIDIYNDKVKVSFLNDIWNFRIKSSTKKDSLSKVRIKFFNNKNKVHIEREDWNIFLDKKKITKNLFLSVIGDFSYYTKLQELIKEENNIMIKYDVLDSKEPNANVVNQIKISLF